jgi:hypothetical protein
LLVPIGLRLVDEVRRHPVAGLGGHEKPLASALGTILAEK